MLHATPSLFGAQAAQLRIRLVRNLLILVGLTGVAVLAVTILGARRTVRELSGMLIEVTMGEAERALKEFFWPVEQALVATAERAEDGFLEDDGDRRLNRILMPLLRNMAQVSSLMVARPGGREFMLLEDTGEWETRRGHVDLRGTVETRQRWKNADALLRTWQQDRGYDPRKRPWHQLAMAAAQDGEVRWTEPYTFFTTKDPGITASLRWRRPGEEPSVLAFDVLLSDISRFTTKLTVGEGGCVFVMTEDRRVVGLPHDARFATDEGIKSAVLQPITALGLPILGGLMESWDPTEGATLEPVRYFAGDEAWWGSLRPYELGEGAVLWVGVAVPEEGFLGGLNRPRNSVLSIVGISMLLAVVMSYVMARQVRSDIGDALAHAQELGEYRLEAKLGSGGIGTVYRGRHRMLRRRTAIKLLNPELSEDEEALARFEREVQHTSELTHPNTIAIYDYGRTAEGVFYYVMEYVEGVTLARLVQGDGPMPPGRVIHVLRQICGSLHEAHLAGLIHRDIKPENVMLCLRGARSDVVKVLDFGLVKNVEGGKSLELTRPDAVTGTPAYMSPEMLRAPKTVGPATDIYAVGGAAYFMLTGTQPFAAASIADVLSKHLHDEPERPSERLGAPVPADLEALVLECLRKDPAQRPDSARDLARRLAACADAGSWTEDDADAWWSDAASKLGESAAVGGEEAATTQQRTVDLSGQGGAGPREPV